MAIENLADKLGNPGKLQVMLYLMLCCNSLFVCWNHLGMAFMAAKTKHHCRVENETAIDTFVPLIEKDGKEQWDSCHLYAGNNKTEKHSCENGWTYYHPDREKTIISKWDLVCDDAYKANLATTIYFCGVMLGGLVFGTLSDKFGRRPILLITVYSPCLIGLLILLLQNSYIAFVVLRFLLGFVLQGLQAASFITIIELFALKYRSTVGTVLINFWAFGVMSLALISFLIQDWRYIQLFITITTIAQIGLIWLLPESFRWLLAQHKFENAENVVRRIARFNKIPFPHDAFHAAEICASEDNMSKFVQKKYTIFDMFRFRVLRLRSVILAWVWFSTSVEYYGISLNISSLAGNKYINFFIGGLLELLAYVMTVFITTRFGRRKPLCFYLMVGSLMGIAAGVLSDKADSDHLRSLTTALAIIGKFGCAGSFSVLFIYTSELFPTVIRNVGLGACASWARLGGVVAPQVLLLGKRTTKAVPFIVFGCFAFVASLISLLLPETLNKNLVDTIEEAGEQNVKSTTREHDMIPTNDDVKDGAADTKV